MILSMPLELSLEEVIDPEAASGPEAGDDRGVFE
jgi:hypothetical protein